MLQDLRFGLRRVFGSPGFSVSVILIIAAGVGVAGTMGSVLNALAFRTVALPDPATLVMVSSRDKQDSPRGTPLTGIAHLKAANLSADGWCAYNSTLDAIASGGRVMEASGEVLSGDCPAVMRISPALGRWFTSEEAPLTGASKPVMVITHRLWQRMFDGRADVLGQQVRIQNVTTTVIGVMPESYRGFSQDLAADYILPFNAHQPLRTGLFLGRLRPGVTVDQLRAEVRTIWPAVLEAVLPPSPTRAQSLAEWTGGAESISGGFSTLRRLYSAPVRRLTVLAAALLLLVCINVGGLLVSRVAARSAEIGAMRALGASTLRVARPLAAECALYATAGSVLGIPLAYLGASAFSSLLPIGNRVWTMETVPDAGVMAVIVAASLAVAMVIAALPIWLATRRASLVRSDRSVSRTTSRWAQSMLVAQVAVTVTLVFTCGLIVRSFTALRSVDRGFESESLLSLRLAANPAGYTGMNAAAYYPALVERVGRIPGVRAVGLARYFGTLNGRLFEEPVGFADRVESDLTGMAEFISPGFFAAAGIPLLSGRDVAWSDLPSTPRVAVVSEAMARALAPDGNVIGQVIRHGTSPGTARLQIVGVVRDISMGNYRLTSTRLIYLPSLQTGDTTFATVHVKTAGPPIQFAGAASAAVAELGREHVMGAYAEDLLFSNSVVAERMGSVVSSVAAMLALAISGIGLFALMAHTVARRTREIGIRLAIGATPGAVSALIIRNAMGLVVVGLLLGLPAAIGASSLVRSLMYGVTATDGFTIAASAAALLLTGVIGAAYPTLRAARVDPVTALRAE